MRIREAKFVRAVVKPDQRPRPPLPTIAFAGRSNSGKSSLINALVRRKGLARTSSTPGRTQEIVYFLIDDRFYFADLPGYGYAKAPAEVRAKWGPMIEGFLKEADELKLVVVMLDARRDPSPDDMKLVQWLETIGVPYLFAATKCDKLGKNALKTRLHEIQRRMGLPDDSGIVPFSAVTGEGRQALLSTLGAVLAEKSGGDGDDDGDDEAEAPGAP